MNNLCTSDAFTYLDRPFHPYHQAVKRLDHVERDYTLERDHPVDMDSQLAAVADTVVAAVDDIDALVVVDTAVGAGDGIDAPADNAFVEPNVVQSVAVALASHVLQSPGK